MELPRDVREALKRPDDLKPYSDRGAAVDALAGRKACRHGAWPHQGECPKCAADKFTFDGVFGCVE